MEGAALGVWRFQDQLAGAALLEQYVAERDGFIPDPDISFAQQDDVPPVRKSATVMKKAVASKAMREDKTATDTIAIAVSEPAALESQPAEDAPQAALPVAIVSETSLQSEPVANAVSHEVNPVAPNGIQQFSWTDYEMLRVMTSAAEPQSSPAKQRKVPRAPISPAPGTKGAGLS
jgi:hypothetical protein